MLYPKQTALKGYKVFTDCHIAFLFNECPQVAKPKGIVFGKGGDKWKPFQTGLATCIHSFFVLLILKPGAKVGSFGELTIANNSPEMGFLGTITA